MVTGCTGLVGHGICFNLLNKGFEVWGTSRGKLISNHELFHPVQFDLKNKPSIKGISNILNQVDILIHNAAILPSDKESSFEQFMLINFFSSVKLIKRAIKVGVKQIIYISASPVSIQKIINNKIFEINEYSPNGNYGISKVLSEIACKNLMLNGKSLISVLRFTAPYGYINNSNAVFSNFFNNTKNNKTITLWGNGNRVQTFTFVEDIGEACFTIIQKRAVGFYTITGPEKVSMKDLANKIISNFPNSKTEITYEKKIDPQEGISLVVSTKKIEEELSFSPKFNIDQGIKKILNSKSLIWIRP